MPVVTQDVKVDNATDILVPKTRKKLDYSNLISGVAIDPKQPVTATIITNKGPCVASCTPPPPPAAPTPTTTPNPNLLSQLLNEGHKRFRTYNARSHSWQGNIGAAQDYLKKCEAFLRANNDALTGRVQVWASQSDMGKLGDAINCTVSGILEPLAEGKPAGQPKCATHLP